MGWVGLGQEYFNAGGCWLMLIRWVASPFIIKWISARFLCISLARAELAEDKSPSFGQQGGHTTVPPSITVLGQEVAMVEEFVYLGSLVHSSTQSSPDISRRNTITRALCRI